MKVIVLAFASIAVSVVAAQVGAQQGCASQLSPSSSVNSLISCMQELEQRIS